MLQCCSSSTSFDNLNNNNILDMEDKNSNHCESLPLLLKSLDSNSEPNMIEETFEKIALELLNNYHIQKGNQEYYIYNLEFYFCNQHHLDIITYPRHLPEGKWFFHQSGFDLTFTSKFEKDNDDKINTEKEFFFGGILIRGVVKKSSPSETFDGPCLCEWEIFDVLDALKPNTSVAHLEPNESLNFTIGSGIYTDHRYFPFYNDNARESIRYDESMRAFNKLNLSESDFKELLHKRYAYKINELLLCDILDQNYDYR